MPVFAGFAAVPQSNSVWVCNAGAVCIVPGFWTGDEVITVHTIDGKWDTVPVSSTLTVKEVLLELHCAHYAAGAALHCLLLPMLLLLSLLWLFICAYCLLPALLL